MKGCMGQSCATSKRGSGGKEADGVKVTKRKSKKKTAKK